MNIEEQIKKNIRKLFDYFGYSVRRKLKNPVLYNKIDLVFDVGANAGQFARDLRHKGYLNRIVSFEPLSSAHKLLSKAAVHDVNWLVHDRCALGSKIGEATINISNNSCSSSILPMLERHSKVAGDSFIVGNEMVKVITFDSVFESYTNPGNKIFLKIDTQGYEHDVLNGASKSLSKISMIQLEMSSTNLYQDQKLADFYFSLLASCGFRLWSLDPIFFDFSTGEVLQFDAVFLNTNI